MKRIIAGVVGVLAVLGGTLWLGTRRAPAGTLLDEPGQAFSVDPAPPGWAVRFVDAQTPLRSLRWLAPRQPGVLVAQVQTQNDRQRVSIFHAGAGATEFLVGRPQGVSEGFWRMARLQDLFVSGDTAVLLYVPGDTASAEPALAMALEPGAQEPRWVHRGNYDRMAVSPGADPGVFLFGAKGPVQRLQLAGTARRPVAKAIDLPPEVPEVEDLLPTGPWTFLASSANGLSAFLGTKGWAHYPPPADKGLACAGWRSTLAASGRRYWWQPGPGRLVQVAHDGTLVTDREVTGMPEEDPLARDAKLLRLLGGDAAGRLWFALAQPAPAEGAEEWATYAAQGLDRIYRWNPDRGTLERFAWSQAWTALRPPPDVAQTAAALHPAAGTLVLEGSRSAWWLPLDALPFRNPGR